MRFEQYLIMLVKRWKLIVICIVVVGVGAFIGSKFMTPTYQATALVEVAVSSGNNQIDYYNILASGQLVQTEAILATSDPVLREVASHYPGLTVDELSSKVTATLKTNTQLFEIDVNDTSPTRAAALANDIANTMIQQTLSQAGSFLYLAQPAQPSLKPVQPNIMNNTAIGIIVGLLLAMSLTLFFEQLDPHIRTHDALTQLLNLPVLSTIPQAGPEEAVVNTNGDCASVESYRILRTNIGFSAINKQRRIPKQPHILIITSALPREGKSVVSANLAIFMARAGKTTLLIDADLRLPTLHETFSLPAHTMGFSNAIQAFSTSPTSDISASQKPTMSTIYPSLSNTLPAAAVSLDPFFHAVDIPNLYVMPSGLLPPNPPELLDSQEMQSFLTALGSCGAEVVIFDTPPLLGLSDTSILASKADGTLVVVDITRAKKRHIGQLKTILEQGGVDVLGCVVNKQRGRHDHTMYPYYYIAHKQISSDSRSRKDGHTLLSRLISRMKEPKT